MMRIFRNFDGLPRLVRPVVTMGSYDGVHAGHRAIIGRITEMARLNGGESVVVTFAPHPRNVLGEGVKLLNTVEEKATLLEEAGIDNLIVAPFTREFAAMPYAEFVSRCLVDSIGVDTFVVGYNHRFGHGKEGNFATLTELAGKLGFKVCEIPRHDVAGGKVSSTIVRNMVEEGRMSRAAECLGYYYRISGRIENGILAGTDPDKLVPGDGRYIVDIAGGDDSCKKEIRITGGLINMESPVTDRPATLLFTGDRIV